MSCKCIIKVLKICDYSVEAVGQHICAATCFTSLGQKLLIFFLFQLGSVRSKGAADILN